MVGLGLEHVVVAWMVSDVVGSGWTGTGLKGWTLFGLLWFDVS